MKVQEYLKEYGLQKLQEEFSIVVGDYEDRVTLNYNQIDSPKFNPVCDECRALILRKGTWEVLARSFNRFYNVGECIRDKNFPISEAIIQEKIDGSLLSLYHDGDKWCVATRKMAFAEGTLPIGITFKQLFDKAIENTKVMDVLTSSTNAPYFTWVFEITSPENRVVTPYNERSVTLIGARHLQTQKEMSSNDLNDFAKVMQVRRPKTFECDSINELQKKAEELNAMDEGFVLVVEQDGSHWRMKCKNPKYVAIAHMRENGGISPKRIMTLVLANEQAEYLSYFGEDKKYFDFCEDVYNESLNRINSIIKDHMDIVEQKEFALTIMPLTKYGHEKGVIFNARKGIPVSQTLKEMGGKKISDAMGLKHKFAKEFGFDEEDEG